MADNASATPSRALSPKRTYYLVGYNVLLVAIMSVSLYNVVLTAAKADLAFHESQAAAREKPKDAARLPGAAAPGTGAEGPISATADTAQPISTPSSEAAIDQALAGALREGGSRESRNILMITYVLWAISLAGGLGGALSNLRGVFEYARDKSYFPEYLELPFYVRPVSGVLCGLFTFFLARFFTIALSSGENLGGGWQTLEGMLPYIGIAFLAGFASQEFMERLKETAKSLFGVPTQLGDAPPANSESAQAGGGKRDLESLDDEIAQPRGVIAQKPKATPPAVIVPQTPLRRGD